jgi:hypothetical protein
MDVPLKNFELLVWLLWLLGTYFWRMFSLMLSAN